VLVIHRAINDEVSALGQCSEGLGRFVALFGSQVKLSGRLLTAQRRRVGYANNLQLLGMRQRTVGVGLGAVAGANYDGL